MKTGACLCGDVAFEVHGELKQVVGCHCEMCRKWTGHFLAFTAAWDDELKLVKSGGLEWFESTPGNRRGFCKRCGSNLFYVSEGDTKTSISVGSLDGKTELQMVAHIFVANKGDYYQIDDGKPQHVRGGDGVQMPSRKKA